MMKGSQSSNKVASGMLLYFVRSIAISTKQITVMK
jgi:hypothetical protein